MTHLSLPKDVDSKFRFITVAAQRAKQLQNGAKARVEARSRKPTRVAMQEGVLLLGVLVRPGDRLVAQPGSKPRKVRASRFAAYTGPTARSSLLCWGARSDV